MRHPADNPESFTHALRQLLRAHGWYASEGWRETTDHDRGTRPSLSEGQVVDELIRRDFKAWGE